MNLSLGLIFALTVSFSTATSQDDKAAELKEAKELLQKVVDQKLDPREFSKMLEPSKEDCAQVFKKEFVDIAAKSYAKLWEQAEIGPGPEHKEVIVFQATTDDFLAANQTARKFPGGYKNASAKLKKGVTWYFFKFVKPGKELGLSFTGLTKVNGKWKLFPKPWRFVESASTKPSSTEGSDATSDKMGRPKAHQGKDRTYVAAENFSIVVPKGWTVANVKGSAAFLTVRGSIEEGGANLNARAVPYDGTPIKKIADEIKGALKSQFKSYKVLEEKFDKLADDPSYMLVATFKIDASGKEIPLQNLQFLVASGKKVFILTYTGTPEYMSKNLAKIKTSALSTVIK